MGSVDVVPGVSGGTMALILGIYEELIGSIRAVGRSAFWHSLLRLRIAPALQAINAGLKPSAVAPSGPAVADISPAAVDAIVSRVMSRFTPASPSGVYLLAKRGEVDMRGRG